MIETIIEWIEQNTTLTLVILFVALYATLAFLWSGREDIKKMLGLDHETRKEELREKLELEQLKRKISDVRAGTSLSDDETKEFDEFVNRSRKE